MTRFVPGSPYTRSEITTALGKGKPSGDWHTGYQREGSEVFVFAAVEASGRTGHDYKNAWLRDDRFRWFGTGGSKRTDAKLSPMPSGETTVHIFWRSADRDPFTYAGVGIPTEVVDGVPIEIVWEISDQTDPDVRSPEELDGTPAGYPVGAGKKVTVNAYERSRAARRDCLRHYGTACVVCAFEFATVYGPIGHGFTHVHHSLSMADIAMQHAETGVEYVIDPIRDLRTVCPNCHAMIHSRSPAYSIEELRAQVSANSGRK